MFNLRRKSYQGTEDDLVKQFMQTFKKEILLSESYYTPDYHEQILIKDIKRRSDLIIQVRSIRKLINVEFKLGDWRCLLNQSIDHLKWADYSYACVPQSYLFRYPQKFTEGLVENGIGLVVEYQGSFIETLRAKCNYYTNKKDKLIRKKVDQILAAKTMLFQYRR